MIRRALAFRWHVALFVVGNLGVALLWVAAAGFPLGWAPAPYWPLWVHLLWGAGLLLHRFSAAPSAPLLLLAAAWAAGPALTAHVG